ncbi:bifunctional (p)ppGpp synthetase/guanosine-3',5'-bis(diphosphate) 3'-pyrophosphohydrolase [uncultured Desulfuromonas sp.]|uniref:RelA/SpoT family protein n=1 Tax=uncultured Desulfuromonas sp. TaxID=181013 RepID=UPI002AABD387|nr:bifunctional (p)ppGpp synthetase/guanosine-3',5'-bis(diphosphate) 3'-pyrophosphohydrolase [uncultured Desulfuromonas sp.]
MKSLEDILNTVKEYLPDADLDLIRRAYPFSQQLHQGQDLPGGITAFSHPVAVAELLLRLRMDVPTVAAGLLHDVLQKEMVTSAELKERFGDQVHMLVEGLTRINNIIFKRGEERQAESFRKMLLAIARDFRIILIKLADRLHGMQNLSCLPEAQQQRIARETMDVYAPLANRMGISWMKSQLEDLSFQHLYPDEYAELNGKVMAFKTDACDQYVQRVKDELHAILAKQGIHGDVSGRSKHIYSVYRKLQRQKIDLDQMYDLIAFRVIVTSVRECYAALGIVHAEWKPVSGRFKDYIAMPKANMYQSLHTSVIGPYGKRMEVQIRTEEMHRIAEEGIAAHWMYKEGKSTGSGEDKRFSWLRQMVEWQKEMDDSLAVTTDNHIDLFPEEVYVFTPQGHVRELPKGACPIDFAYAIHGDIGHRCVGAKVNNKMVSLKTELHNGDVVEVLTSPHQNPSKDWLKIVKTSKARNRIRHWVKTQEREKSIEVAHGLLDKELRKYGKGLNKTLNDPVMAEAAKDLGFKEVTELLAAVGYGKLSAGQVVSRIVPADQLRSHRSKLSGLGRVINKIRKKPSHSAIRIQGIDDVLVRFAKCCNPLPGDDIVGFITRGHGITVHAADCPHLLETDPQRRVEVEWDEGSVSSRSVRINVYCHDHKGVLAEITSCITKCEANITSARVNASSGSKGLNEFEIDVNNVDHLKEVMAALKALKGVYRVERVRERRG